MRTTLTLDDDVAARVHRLCETTGISLKEGVNRLLRAGLDHTEQPCTPRPTYRLQPASMGPSAINLDRSGELLALDDEQAWRQGQP